jgi:hypothetical protein
LLWEKIRNVYWTSETVDTNDESNEKTTKINKIQISENDSHSDQNMKNTRAYDNCFESEFLEEIS